MSNQAGLWLSNVEIVDETSSVIVDFSSSNGFGALLGCGGSFASISEEHKEIELILPDILNKREAGN